MHHLKTYFKSSHRVLNCGWRFQDFQMNEYHVEALNFRHQKKIEYSKLAVKIFHELHTFYDKIYLYILILCRP